MHLKAYELFVAVFLTFLLGVCLGAPLDATPAIIRRYERPCQYEDRLAASLVHSRGLLQEHNGTSGSKPAHKPLLPTSQYDVAMFVVAGIVLFIAAGAGMGGGPVLVPLYLTLGAFHQQAAVALSNSTILAGSVANVLVNARKRHPFRNKPLVDWDLILLMQPPTLIGAIAGSYINKLLPAWISHLLLALLLTLMTVRVLQRALMIFKRETEAQQQPYTVGSRHEMLTEPDLAAPAAAALEASTAQCTADPQALSSCSSPSRSSSIAGHGTVQMVILHADASPGKALAIDCPTAAGPAPASSSTEGSSNSSSITKPAGGMLAVASSRLGGTLQTSPARQQQLQDQVQLDSLQHHQQQEQRGSSEGGALSDGLMPNEMECRLAYAPPGHTRRSSWELQDGWDDAWEAHSCEGDSAQSRLDASQPELGTARSAGASSKTTALGEKALLNSGRASSAPLVDVVVMRPSAPPASSATETGAVSGSGAGLEPRSHGDWAQGYGSLGPAAGTVVTDACAIVHKTSTGECSSSGGSFSTRQAKAQQQPPELSVHSPELQALLTAEAAQLPLVPVLLLVVLFIAVMLTSLFSKSCNCGSLAFWLVQWLVAPVLLAVWWYSRGRVLKKVALKRVAGLDFHGDIRWSRHNSIIFPAICSFAGVIAGMFGLGGAVVKTPLMLELGVQPQVTAATTQTMLLLTTAASTVVYSQLGDIPWEYAAVLMPMAFAATLAGQFAIDWVVKKLGRSSVVVIVLAAFFVVACGLTYYIAIDSLKAVAADPVASTVPGKICAGG